MSKWRVDTFNSSVEFTLKADAEQYKQQHGGDITEIQESVIVQTPYELKEIQDKLLQSAWDFINPYFDQPAFIQILDWKNTFPDDSDVVKCIKAVETWKSAIMFEHMMIKKTALWSGGAYDFDYAFIGSPPCKFTDLFLLANPALQSFVPDWTPPDISSYQPGTRQSPKPVLF